MNTSEVVSSSTDKKSLRSKKKTLPLDRKVTLSVKTRAMIKKELQEIDSESSISKHRNRQERVARKPLGELHENKKVKKSSIPFAVSSIVKSKAPAVDNVVVEPKGFIKQIIENSKRGELFLNLTKEVAALEDCCKQVYNSEIICKDVLQTAIKTQGIDSTWKKERKFRITGSRCYSLFTYSKGNWSEKSYNYFWPREFSNMYTEHGNHYESIAREVYKKEKKSHVEECGLIISESEPWAAYSPDGIVFKDSTCKLLEIKCPYNLRNTSDEALINKCKFLCVKNEKLQLKERHQYYAQIQFGMALLNLKDCDFVIYSSISNSIRIFNVKLDENYAKNLLEVLKERYFEKMLHEICCNSYE